MVDGTTMEITEDKMEEFIKENSDKIQGIDVKSF